MKKCYWDSRDFPIVKFDSLSSVPWKQISFVSYFWSVNDRKSSWRYFIWAMEVLSKLFFWQSHTHLHKGCKLLWSCPPDPCSLCCWHLCWGATWQIARKRRLTVLQKAYHVRYERSTENSVLQTCNYTEVPSLLKHLKQYLLKAHYTSLFLCRQWSEKSSFC